MGNIKQRKAKLRVSVESHKLAINRDFSALANKTEKVVGGTAIAIGILLSLVSLYKILSNEKSKKRSKKSNRLMTVVKQQLALFVLNEGRSKIMEYINSFDETES